MDNLPKPVSKNRFIVAVDFDGTIVEWRPGRIGPIVPGAIGWLKKLQTRYHALLVLWTVRSDGQPNGDMLTAAVEFCHGHGLVFDYVNYSPTQVSTSRKIWANIFIDDMACGCPLTTRPDTSTPFVDWSVVGPQVTRKIAAWNRSH